MSRTPAALTEIARSGFGPRLLGSPLTAAVLVTLVAACGGEGQSPSDGTMPSTLTAELTAREIMARASEAGESIGSMRIVQTEHYEFLRASESVTEMILVDDDFYVKASDEDGISEALYYRGHWYARSSPNASWEIDPTLEGVSAELPSLVERAEEAVSDQSFSLTRLEDEVIDGRTLLGVRLASTAGVADVTAALRGVTGIDGELPPLPMELQADEVSATVDFWIGADDFQLYRWEQEAILYKNGSPISSTRRTAEASDFDQPLTLPGPLPDES